ncbi:ABC transporter substrate-binding protein [Nocardioides sp. HDW12B]|uniref:ABC transporter substrate-binding protein n=1 Tax=Nocardioides sp. HDW12B TaxID=2714939 RepID=UPI001407EB43|nr:ABC transporter substrate-binding protein [Nocardioides sp. HDW12B]QIK65947.1 ABC transporter substrate-binding protein [Nocardioides sp. HDW12B]
MRIVSLLPSATEILFDLGAGDDVVGVTFECDHPAEARQRRIVSTTALPAGLSPSEIDAFVAGAVARGEDLYHLDAGALADLDPDLVVTQDLCAVCAIDVDTVDGALQHLGCRAEVVTVDPQTLAQVLESVLTIGAATCRSDTAAGAVAAAKARLDVVRRRVAGRPRPRVLVLEWTDPPYSPGHWLPDLVEAAGGVVALGASGARSSRITWHDVRSAAADLVVVAPCGYDLDSASGLARQLVDDGLLPADVPVWAADANASWTRPALRLVDAVEDLAAVLHPAEDLPAPATLAAVHSSKSRASA